MDPRLEIHFDSWTLRRQSGELVRPDGTRIRLQTQPLHVLEELLARPGELVTREQLIARLWPKGVVDFDTALNSAVRRLRTALGDHAETPIYIETIPRRGYRFIGRVGSPIVAGPANLASAAPSVAPPAPAEPVPAHHHWWSVATGLLVVALAIAAVLSARIDDRPPGPGTQADSVNPQAHERYLRARHFFQRRAPGDIELSRRYFEEAIAIDPEHARAWAGLAGAYWLETLEGTLSPELGLPKVRDTAERALALDPRLADAHLRLAAYLGSVGELRKRDEHLRKALELEPDSPLVLSTLAGNAAHDGQFDTAIALQRRAVEADPLSTLARYNLGSILYLAGRRDEAKSELLALEELNPAPDYVNEVLGRVLVLEGRHAEVLELVREWPDESSRRHCLALAYHGLGRSSDSDATLATLAASSQFTDRIRVAEVHAYRGEIDEAFRWLNLATQQSSAAPWPLGERSGLWIVRRSPFLQPLHADPRWTAWLASTGDR